MKYTIIPAEVKHAQQIIELRRTPGVIEHTLGLPSERAVKFEAQWKEYNPNLHNFVAIDESEKAINLYKKFGFEIEGTMKAAAISQGEYKDEYMMSRI